MSLQIRRGNETDRLSKTFDPGELIWTTDSNQLWVGDGIHAGGINAMASMAGVGLTYNQSTKKIDFTANGVTLSSDSLTEGSTNLFYTTARAQGDAAALFANGTHSHISFIYNPSSHSISATVDFTGEGILSVSADTNPSLGGSLNIGNYSITSTGTGNINIAGTINASTGLGGNLSLNSHNITGTGNISITGILSSSQTTNGQPLANFYGEVYPVDSWISLNMSRGTPASPSAVHAGDTMSGIIVYGHDGSNYSQAVAFGAEVDSNGTVATGAVPGSFVVITTKTGGGRNQLLFSSTGVLTAPVIQTGLYNTSSYPSNPSKGMIIFDQQLNHFYGYNGTAWVAFTGP